MWISSNFNLYVIFMSLVHHANGNLWEQRPNEVVQPLKTVKRSASRLCAHDGAILRLIFSLIDMMDINVYFYGTPGVFA